MKAVSAVLGKGAHSSRVALISPVSAVGSEATFRVVGRLP